MSEEKIPVAVVGASGYTGQELLRLLVMHPRVTLAAVTSRRESGRTLAEVFPRLRGSAAADSLRFMMPEVDAIVATGAEVAFLALPHGLAAEYALPLLEKGLKVIDLSADFRVRDPGVYEEFYGAPHPAPDLLKTAVYGLPELYRDEVAGATLIASPGCYPTSILVPTIPLLEEGLIDPATLVVSSLSGASGAGKKADVSLLFAEVNESLRAYGAPKHRHLSEIEQEMSLAADRRVTISFVPHLMPITAGIATTVFASYTGEGNTVSDQVEAALRSQYEASPFVRILGEGCFADTKHVVGTNFVDVGWVVDERTGRLILSSAEDNLGKGAGSQAIQSFNLLCGLPEECGLLHF